jgi:BlaI family transcriptional regulator, penicillinase repressor
MATRSIRKHSLPTPLPSDAELDILAAVWRLGPSTVRDVHEALGKDSGYTTTLKQMQLMTEKGLLVRSERFRSHIYEAGVAKEQTQRQIAADMLKRGFEGSAKNLVLGALAAQPASRQECEEIRRILDELDRRKESR